MSSAVAVKSEEKKSQAASQQSVPDPMQLQYSSGAAGLPRFLQPGPRIQVQAKCAKCQEKEEVPFALQSKCSCGGAGSCGCDQKTGGIQSAAREGVAGAHQRLPHLDRIQASFGRHDVTGARASIGGAAAVANQRMGSLAYTTLNRIAFGHEPDVKLAAHEAAHVVQQRNGAKLPDGVGRPGDEYEQQADTAAEAVDRGESAEPILDHASLDGPSWPAMAVQRQLQVNATRKFEPPVLSGADLGDSAPAPLAGGAVPAPKAKTESAAKGPEEAGKSSEAPGPKTASGSQPAGGLGAPGPAGGAAGPNAAGANTAAPNATEGNAPPDTPQGQPEPGADAPPATAPQQSAAGKAPCTSGTVPRCYDKPSDQPAQDPDEQPPNPEVTKVQEETSSGDEQDLPEVDDCPAQQAQAGVPSASQYSSAAPASPAPASAAGASGPSGPSAPSAPSASTPPASTGADSKATRNASSAGKNAVTVADADLPLQSLGSPLDGAVAAGERQRSAAVTSYASSSAMLGGASNRTPALRKPIVFAPQPGESAEGVARREAASTRAEGFFSNAADKIDLAIGFASQQMPEQLGARAESAKAQIGSSIETQKAAISASVNRARAQARTEAKLSRSAVASQAASFVADAQAQTVSAIRSLTENHSRITQQVAELETSTLDSVNQVYSDGRSQLEGLGTAIGDECTATGGEFATKYTAFANCTENGFWDGDLSERRAAAQAEAAGKTAKGYHDRIVESAKKRAHEISRDGRKKDRCGVIAAATQTRQLLDEQLAKLTAAFEMARDAAIEQAGSARDSLIASIDSGLGSTLRQLDQTEHEQRQSADDTGYIQQVMQEQVAYAGGAALQSTVNDAATVLHKTLLDLQSRFSASNPPDVDVLDHALATVSAKIDFALGSVQSGLISGTSLVEQQLGGAAGAGLAVLNDVGQRSNDTVASLSGGFASAMATVAGTDNFATQRQGFTQQIEKALAGGNDALAQALDGMHKSCDSTLVESRKALAKASTDLEANLRQSKQGIECDITQHADEAASKEAPSWKRLLAVLLVILVVLIIIAVVVFSGGLAAALGGPIVAGILVGAAVGAATSALLAMAGNLWGNRAVMKGVAHAALVGAITGAIGGGIGAGVGVALKSASLVVQYGAALITSGVLDTATQLIMNGTKNFSWGNLGITLIVTALTLGLAHGVGAIRAGTGPATAGGGDQPAPVADQPAPAADQPAPVADQPAPVAEQPAPVADQPAPVAEQPAPAADQPAPVADQPAPVAEQPAPVAEQPTPAADSAQTAESESQPIPGDRDQRTRVIRQDDDFQASLNRKGVPKSHLDADGSLVPANPNGEATPLEHIYGSMPAKGDSPYTSFLTEEGGIAKSYGGQEVELDVPRLKADIASGSVTGVEVLTPPEIETMIRADIERVAPGVDADAGIARGPAGIDEYVEDLGLSKGKSAQLARRLLALYNTTRDGEFLIKGIIPPGYTTAPTPNPPPTGATP